MWKRIWGFCPQASRWGRIAVFMTVVVGAILADQDLNLAPCVLDRGISILPEDEG